MQVQPRYQLKGIRVTFGGFWLRVFFLDGLEMNVSSLGTYQNQTKVLNYQPWSNGPEVSKNPGVSSEVIVNHFSPLEIL